MNGRTFAGLTMILITTVGCNFVFNSIAGSGISATENRQITSFGRLSMAGHGDINIQCGQPHSLALTTDDNLIDLIETEVKNGELRIEATESIAPRIGPKFDITTEELSGISIAGSADVAVVDFAGDELALHVAGSGSFHVVGSAETVRLEIAGSGDADLTGLVAQRVDIKITGSGDARVHATEKLTVSIAGSGDIAYIGDPTIEQSIAGAGSVQRIEDASSN